MISTLQNPNIISQSSFYFTWLMGNSLRPETLALKFEIGFTLQLGFRDTMFASFFSFLAAPFQILSMIPPFLLNT